jgi:hypothetical protein
MKVQVKEVLDRFNVYYFMPVQSGIGAAGVDFHCVVRWRGFALAFFIETKKFGDQPTIRQSLFLKDREEQQNAKTFVIHSFLTLKYLVEWLESLARDQ